MSFIGIDIGTSSICGVAHGARDTSMRIITKTNDTGSVTCHQRTQNPKAIYAIVEDIIAEFRHHQSPIEGIGLSGQMHGMLYVDDCGEPLSPLYTWQDGRGLLPFRDGMNYVEWLSQRTGMTLATGFGLVTHFYNMKNGLVPSGAARLCTIMDYVAMRLAGGSEPTTDSSNAASLGFFDTARMRFDTGALEKVGINPAILPQLRPATFELGRFDGIPVFGAIGDNQAAFLGSVGDPEHSIHLTVGTSGQISVYSNRYVAVTPLDTRPLPGGGYILVGAALCGGEAFATLKNLFVDTITLCTGKEMNGGEIYRAMTSIPWETPLPDDPKVVTLLAGTRLEPAQRGGITALSTTNLTPERLIRAFLRGVAEELYGFYRLIPEDIRAGKSILVGSGNGIRKNRLLRAALEERFDCSLEVSVWQEEAALGACLCAMVGSGHIASFADFDRIATAIS